MASQICRADASTTPVGGCAARRARQPVLIAASCSRSQADPPAPAVQRRAWLAAGAAAALAPLLLAARPPPAQADSAPSSAAPDVGILSDEAGSGTAEARLGDLVLLHYVGKTAAGGTLFDSTRGGAAYRDGGTGALRPAVIRVGGTPVPGICAGLQAGLLGMRVGGKRTFTVPASLGFGREQVLGPYGVVPGGSDLVYEVELLRLSRAGPEALMSGVAQCGGGAVMERTIGCAVITYAEFL